MSKKAIYLKKIRTGAMVGSFMAFLFPAIVFGYQIERIDTANVANRDFSVGPGKVELEIVPGGKQTVNIRVSNRLGENRIFEISASDFTGSKNPSETVLLLEDERGPYSLKDFISVSLKSFELAHGEQAIVPVTISVPTDASPGGLYGSVLISTASAKSTTPSSASRTVSRIGTLFFVKVPGDIVEDGKITEFETAGARKFFSKGPIVLRLLYENNGNIHLNPYGEIRVKNIFGRETEIIPLDPWFAMPQSLRLREVSFNKKFLFGRYTATADVNRGYDDIIDTNSLSFWVIPWSALILLFALIAAAIFVFKFFLASTTARRK